MQKPIRIHSLDNRLANQIAAGEVVERPASVVKELLENSIDSGASRIEVEIVRGGTRLIKITDDGAGIHKDDLALALTRHATSKIKTIDDLGAIETLGFRGEALASISSVSRLTLTSRQQESDSAWQAVAQGMDMAVEVLPAAAAKGTRLEVADIFFNTPARQKFMRTEKTEFSHIEEVFKQHALVNTNIAFVLKHNHKVVKRIPAIASGEQALNRIASICGKSFAENTIALKCKHELMSVSGWLGNPSFHRSESDIQYVFVNSRPVKDKTLNHAIKQAYADLLPTGRMPAYVIFINIDPSTVDVNVHPTKHEVRFDQQRLVHDLLAKSVRDCLLDFQPEQQVFNSNTENTEENIEHKPNAIEPNNEETFYFTENQPSLVNPLSYPVNKPSQVNEPSHAVSHFYQPESAAIIQSSPTVRSNNSPVLAENQSTLTNLLKLNDLIWLGEYQQQVVAFKLAQLAKSYVMGLLSGEHIAESKALLFPQKLEVGNNILENYSAHLLIEKLGFKVQLLPQGLKLMSVPKWLTHISTEELTYLAKSWLEQQVKIVGDKLLSAQKIINQLSGWEKLTQSQVEPLFMAESAKTQSSLFKPIEQSAVENLFAIKTDKAV